MKGFATVMVKNYSSSCYSEVVRNAKFQFLSFVGYGSGGNDTESF